MKKSLTILLAAVLSAGTATAMAQVPSAPPIEKLDPLKKALSKEEIQALKAPKLNKAQKEILLGRDDNENHIRDDVDAFIKAQQDLSRAQRNSLSQMALVFQEILVRDTTKPTKELAFALNQAEGCFYWQMGKESLDKQGELYAKLMGLILNTPERRARFDATGKLPEYKPELSWQWAAELRCTYHH